MKDGWFYLIFFAAGLLGGLLIRDAMYRNRNETVRTEYVRGETVRDTVRVPYPVREEVPVYYTLPVRYDTVYIDSYIYVREKVDTAAIIAEYIVKRTYELNVFDDDNGTMTATVDLQYNRLQRFGYEFTPIRRVDRSLVVRTWTPFVGASYSTFGIAGVGGGLFYHDIAVEYQFCIAMGHAPLSNTAPFGHLIGLKWKL